MKTVLRLVGLIALVVLAGCSTPPPPEDKVATLETTGAAPTASSVAPTASRPRERLDMTNDEIIALWDGYNLCLNDNGAGKGKSGDGLAPEAKVEADDATVSAAEAACLGKKPLPPWEYDSANPESADFVHEVVLCLRGKGVQFVEESPLQAGEDRRGVALGGEQNDSDSITKGLDLIPVCEKELSAG